MAGLLKNPAAMQAMQGGQGAPAPQMAARLQALNALNAPNRPGTDPAVPTASLGAPPAGKAPAPAKGRRSIADLNAARTAATSTALGG